MKRRVFSIPGGVGWSIFFLLMLSSFFSPVYAQSPQTSQPSDKPSDQAGDSRIQLLKPEEGCLNIAKKAMIKCAIKTPFDSTKLLVLLDGTDISGILDITPEGFEHKATGVLAREFKFSTCHSKTFDEIYSSNEITTVAEKKIVKAGDTDTSPSWKVESNLASESKIKKGEWEFLYKTNLRYFGQDMAVTPPPDKGFSLANYLFQAKYNGSKINFLAETGDVTIDETPNTVTGLARRGGNLVFESKDLNLKLRTFDVKSEQLFGFVGGPGLGTTPNDHIMGASADLGIISDKLRFRTIYVRGGEQGDSLGTTTTTPIVTPEETPSYGNSSTTNQRKGDVLGFLLTSDFFDKKFVTEAELDFSRFDADTTDEFRAKRDKAYRLKASGTIKDYTYEALYEYVGRDYEVIGNPGLSKDKEGYSLKGGGTFFKIHLLNLSFSQYHDNVKKDDPYPRSSYQRSMVSTKDEPIDILPTKTDTDTVTGQIHYKKGPWDLGFQTSYSFQKDKTPADNDNTTITYTFTPTYTKDFLTITPSFSYNRSLAHNTGVHTDTYTATLDLKGDLFKKRVTYGLVQTSAFTTFCLKTSGDFWTLQWVFGDYIIERMTEYFVRSQMNLHSILCSKRQ